MIIRIELHNIIQNTFETGIKVGEALKSLLKEYPEEVHKEWENICTSWKNLSSEEKFNVAKQHVGLRYTTKFISMMNETYS